MKKTNLSAVLSTAIVCFLFWLLITGQIISIFRGAPSVQVLVAGILVSVFVALFSSRFFIHENAWHLFSGRFIQLIVYCFTVFPVELFNANFDVAMRALNPKLPVNPGFVKVPVNLKTEYGRAMLANSITLTPGTITMDIVEEEGQTYYYIHWIDVTEQDPEKQGKAIKGILEEYTGRIWE